MPVRWNDVYWNLQSPHGPSVKFSMSTLHTSFAGRVIEKSGIMEGKNPGTRFVTIKPFDEDIRFRIIDESGHFVLIVNIHCNTNTRLVLGHMIGIGGGYIHLTRETYETEDEFANCIRRTFAEAVRKMTTAVCISPGLDR